jgi:hypothetical protein
LTPIVESGRGEPDLKKIRRFLRKDRLAHVPALLIIFVLSAALSPNMEPVDPYWKESDCENFEDTHREYCEAITEANRLIDEARLAEAERTLSEAEPRKRSVWRLGSHGFYAYLRLGDAHGQAGERSEALRIYKIARPGGGCGNCMAGQAIIRNDRIARLREKNLNYPAALASYVSSAPATILGGGFHIVGLGLARTGAICGIVFIFATHFFKSLIRKIQGRPSSSNGPKNGFS